MNRAESEYVGYEYKEVPVESSRISIYMDGYRHFGWQPDENRVRGKESGKTLLYLKRDRKIMNKAELTRLQRNFEDCMKQIEILEKSRTSRGTALSVAVGMAGTMFMAGSTFAVTAEPPVIWLCALLAVPGFAGWILPHFCYKAIVKKRTGIVTPLIEDKYDEVYGICEKGNRLLGNPDDNGGEQDEDSGFDEKE